jgi:hypothetical protein
VASCSPKDICDRELAATCDVPTPTKVKSKPSCVVLDCKEMCCRLHGREQAMCANKESPTSASSLVAGHRRHSLLCRWDLL